MIYQTYVVIRTYVSIQTVPTNADVQQVSNSTMTDDLVQVEAFMLRLFLMIGYNLNSIAVYLIIS